MIAQNCFSEALIDGAKEVFEKMVFIEVNEMRYPAKPVGDMVLLGSITFRNDIEGCLNVSCDRQCGRTIALNMLGMPQDSQIQNEEINDAIGEITNMLLGSLKARMLDELKNLQVSIPVVTTGQNIQSSLGEGTQRIAVCLMTSDNHIIELTLLYREGRKK
jgi:chemotaxis protein CheX